MRAVYRGSWHAARDEAVYLILHQRQKRRHDDCDSFATECWRLVAQRLTPAGWHHHERVAVIEHALDRFALERQKRVEAPILLQRLLHTIGKHRQGSSL